MTNLFGAIAAGLLVLSTAAQAQTNTAGGSSGRMWGDTANTPSSQVDSSLMHSNDGVAASEVNAAKAGVLYGGANITITSIGSQSIVNTSVIGNGNTTSVVATQTTTNSGAVTNNGTVAPKP